MTARHYDAFGLRLAVECDDPAMMAAVHARLRRWAVVDQSPPDLRFEIRARPAATHAALLDIDSSGSRPVYDPPVGEVVYAEESDCLLVRKVGAVRAVCHPGAGRAEVLFDPSDARAYWYASHPVFTLCLVEMLRRRAFFNLHAAALARDGRGVLIAGASGAGKSTLTISLVRAGFDFLGDDTCFLTARPDGVRILAFPDELDVTSGTIRFFPELQPLLNRPLRPGASKRQLAADEVYGVAPVPQCTPGVILFPRIAPGGHSSLEPWSAGSALLELMPNVLLTHPASAQLHLDLLSDLVGRCACYRLNTGRDFDRIPGLIDSLLTEAVPAAVA